MPSESVLTHSVNGSTVWHDAIGRLHRADGPAFIDGPNQIWYFRDLYHRTDGPAIMYHNHNEWWLDGRRHREDGPAIEWPSGNVEWWYDSQPYEFNDFVTLAKWTEDRIIEWKLTHG